MKRVTWEKAFQKMTDCGIIAQPVERTPIVEKWDEQIDGLVSNKAKRAKKHYSNQFRWHLFSFELLPALQKEQASTAFDSTPKSELYMFFDYADEAFLIKKANLFTAGILDELWENSPLDYADIYLFDPKKKWTYVRTHEELCGPYFFKV